MSFLPDIKTKIYEIKDEVVEHCEKCDGSGYRPEGAGKVSRCDCMVVFRYLKELVKARIPRDYWGLSFGGLKIDPEYKQFVKIYIKNMRRAKENGLGLVFSGRNGIGKTSLMCELGKIAITKGYSVSYFTLSSYVTALYRKDQDTLDSYEDGDFLLIDELDKQAESKNLAKTVDEFLRRMFNEGKSLLLGTNWDEDQLKLMLGESTVSLLHRKSQFLEMKGEDYSDTLKENYLRRLTEEFDYENENILKMADRMERNYGKN